MEQSGFQVLAGQAFFDAGLLLPSFRRRFPWIGGDLQTLGLKLLPSPAPGRGGVGEVASEEIVLALRKPDEGKLTALIETPSDDQGKGTVLMLHGLGGQVSSGYMRSAAGFFLGLGYRVVRLNLRAAGSSAPFCSSHYHAGLSDDLEDAIRGLPDAVTGEGLYLMGFSLGANVLLKYLGEGRRLPVALRASVSVSAPMDLARSLKVIDRSRNWIYRRYLVNKLKATCRSAPITVGGEAVNIGAIRSVRQYDQEVVAPMHGFRDADDYYRKCSAKYFVPHIESPTLVVHAATDPWIPPDIYRSVDWPAGDRVCAVLTTDGGHVGFHSAGSKFPWYLSAAEAFFRKTASA